MTKDNSYAIGMNIGASLKRSGVSSLDYEALSRGLRHVLEGLPTELSEKEAGELLSKYFGDLAAKRAAAAKQQGQDFLTRNALMPGVTKLPSGLQYTVMVEGKGPKPKHDSIVRCHYTGTLLDGTEFDSSVRRGQPADFPVNGVIAGWTEALQLMAVGSKWKLFIPYNLAYGDRGAGDNIPPYAALIFEVELLEIRN